MKQINYFTKKPVPKKTGPVKRRALFLKRTVFNDQTNELTNRSIKTGVGVKEVIRFLTHQLHQRHRPCGDFRSTNHTFVNSYALFIINLKRRWLFETKNIFLYIQNDLAFTLGSVFSRDSAEIKCANRWQQVSRSADAAPAESNFLQSKCT